MDPTLDEASQLHCPAERLRTLSALSEQHRLCVAANPAAPVDLLESLAASGSPAVRKKLALNPSISGQLFWGLAAEFPHLSLNNPLFQLLLMEHPTIATIPTPSLLALLGTGRMEPSWFEVAYAAGLQNYALLQGLILLHNVPTVILLQLAEKLWCTDEILRRASLPPEIVRVYMRCRRVDIRVKFAASPHAPPEWLAEAALTEVQVRSAVASNHRTPRETLERLLSDRSEDIQRRAALNPSLASDIVLRNVQEQMQQQPSWSPEGLLLIHGNLFRAAIRARDSQQPRKEKSKRGLRTRLGMALRPTTQKRAALFLKDAETLALLARSPSASVRQNVARNPATTASLLTALASDSDPKVRALVAWHDETPAEVRAVLERDPTKAVRKAVERKNFR